MKTQISENHATFWISGSESWQWATQWPCSQLSGKRICASFDRNGLCELSINGKDAPEDLDATELNAIVADFAARKLPEDHALWYVIVGQFKIS